MLVRKPSSEMMIVSSLPPQPTPVTKITKENFEEICRCCVVNKGEMNVFEAHFQNKPLRDLIYACTNEEIVPNDGLPKTICTVCMQLIISSYTFSNKVKDIQVKIRDLQKVLYVQSCEAKNDTTNDNSLEGESEINLIEEEPSNRENFKYKFKGLRKVYNQLMGILEENKQQIKRPIKADSQYYSSLRLEKINNEKVDLEAKEEAPDPATNIEEKPQPVIAVTNDKTSTPEEEDLAASNLSESEIFQLSNDVEVGHKKTQQSDDCLIEDQQNEAIEQIEYPNQIGSENLSPTKKNKCTKSETFTEVINGKSLNFLEVYTMPEDVLGDNFEELVKSSFDRFKLFEGREEGSVGRCFDCSKTLFSEKDWIQHCRETGHVMAHRFKCKICSLTFALRRSLSRHMKGHNIPKTMCNICGAMVNSNYLPKHMLIHEGGANHICQICGKTFSQKGKLDEHVRHKHMGASNKCLCFLCGKSFRVANSLNKHLDEEHKDDGLANKSFTCPLCPRYFVSQKSLDLHVRYGHGDERGKRKGITEAQKLSQKKYGSRPKQCPICHKFICYSGFKVHMYIHQGIKPYKCKVCNVGFRQASSLKTHMNLHLNLKPYKCEFCEKRFRHLTTFRTHVRGHTGETPYICPICDKGFTHSSSMKKHQQTHVKKSRNHEQSTSVTVEFDSDNKTDSDSDE